MALPFWESLVTQAEGDIWRLLLALVLCCTCLTRPDDASVSSRCDIVYAGHCYFISDQKLTWTAAKSQCSQQEGYLVNIGSEAENNNLLRGLRNRNRNKTWTGCNDLNKEGKWLWDNSGNTGEYFKWAFGQPDDYINNEDCGTLVNRNNRHVQFNGKWNDEVCTGTNFYICERDIDECSSGSHKCHAHATCTNTDGHFPCSCNKKLIAPQRTCTVASGCDVVYGGHCYFISSNKLNWHAAKQKCREQSSYLLNIGSAAENNYILQLLGYRDMVWTGYNDINQEGKWVWSNTGSTGKFLNWADGQPDNYTTFEDCCTLVQTSSTHPNFNTKWNDETCNHPTFYVCERGLDECNSRNHQCDANAACSNSSGSFSCSCNKKFTGDGRTCNKITCTPLPNLANGNRSTEDLTVDTIVRFECNAGYRHKGSLSSKCLVNQTWSGKVPTCTDIDECSSAGSNNCSTNAKCRNLPGAFSCKCNENFTGNGTTCTKITCPFIPQPKNGSKSTEVRVVGTVVTFSCNTGYQINRQLSVVCRVDGQWSGAFPTCADINECSSDGHQCNINGTCTNIDGGYSCACNEKFIGDGRVCTRLSCPPLDPPDNGRITTNDSFVDTIVDFVCKPGYILKGLSVKCLLTQRWNGTMPICEAVQCENLLSRLSNTVINLNNFNYPNTIYVTCNRGYWIPQTHTKLFCNSSGLWSPPPMECGPVTCPKLNNASSWTVDVSDVTVWATANYSCNKGYVTKEMMQNTMVDSTVAIQTCTPSDGEINRTETPIGEWRPGLPGGFCSHKSKEKTGVGNDSQLWIIISSTGVTGITLALLCIVLWKWRKRAVKNQPSIGMHFDALEMLRQSTSARSNPSTDTNQPSCPQDDPQYNTVGHLESLYAVAGPAASTNNPENQYSVAGPAVVQSTTHADDDNMYAHLSHHTVNRTPQQELSLSPLGQNFTNTTDSDDYAHLERSTTQKILASRTNT